MIKEKLLVEALERRVEGANPFPVELLNETELGPSARGQAEPELDRSPRLELPLEHVFEGGRADALFDLGRRWAYRQSKGIERVLVYLIQQNQRFPTSLEFHEVKSTGAIDRSGDLRRSRRVRSHPVLASKAWASGGKGQAVSLV